MPSLYVFGDGVMGIELIPGQIRKRFRIEERGHACAILKEDFPHEWRDLLGWLDQFTLTKTDVLTPGGNKSPPARAIDAFFNARAWKETKFDVVIRVDQEEWPTPTHGIDNFKNHVGIEVEWNNKDPFFDRDLNNFRLLHQIGVLSVGVIVTPLWEMQDEFKRIGKGGAKGKATTHWDKLIPKVNGGGAGGCPLLLIGLGFACYDPNR